MVCGALLLTLGTLTWRQSRMYSDNETLWQTTARQDPESSMAHNNLGNVFLGQQRYDEAISHLRTAARLKPNSFNLSNLGAGLAQTASARRDANVLAEAERTYLQALQLNPGSGDAHYGLGLIRLEQGRASEAAGEFGQVVGLDSGRTDAWYWLGQALAMQGKRGEAAEHYRQALRINPHFAEAQQALNALENPPGPAQGGHR
jgi:tetratricopeptide (TPR) repeat protein